MAVKSKTALETEIDVNLASASNITAAEHREVAKDIVDSYEDFVGSYTTAEIAALVGMTLRQRVFNTTDNDYEYYDGTRWVKEAHPKYKVYRALLTQTSTNAPVATVLENNLGGTVVWAYLGVGEYSATLVGAFPQTKTGIVHGDINDSSADFNYVMNARRASDDMINVICGQTSIGVANGIITDTLIVITVDY